MFYMKSLQSYISNEQSIIEMASIGRPILNKTKYLIAIHGSNAKDRLRPHIHIYLNDDHMPFNKFNFEIALDEIICYDELNVIKMLDKKNHKNISNRDKCNWSGYNKLKNDFEDWLFDKAYIRGDFIDNLDAIIYWYNEESDNSTGDNPLLEYIRTHGMKVMKKYWKYFSEEDKKSYSECF